MEHFYKITDDQIKDVYNFFNTDEVRLKNDVNMLKEWLSKQPHLPQNVLTDTDLKHSIIRNKCLLEKTKQTIDAYFTLKGIYSEFVKYTEIVPSKCSVFYAPLPELLDGERVFVCKLRDPDNHTFADFTYITGLVWEIETRYGICKGYKVIFDYDGYTFSHITKINPVQLSNLIRLFLEGHSSRITSINYLNAPSFTDYALALVKPFLKPKLYNRIHIYKNKEEMFKDIPQRIMFKDYGGEAMSMRESLKYWDQIVEDNKAFLAERLVAKANEKLRIGKSRYCEQEEIHGTFRKINID